MIDADSSVTASSLPVAGAVDGQLLAGLLTGRPGERWAELGSGVGNCAIQAAMANPDVQIDGLEIQESLAAEARRHIVALGLAERVRIHTGDVRTPPDSLLTALEAERRGFDQLFCNPPFRRPGQGRQPPDESTALSRFELAGGLDDFLACASRLLAWQGSCHLVHLPERLPEIFQACAAHRLAPFRLIPVQDRPDRPALRVLFSAMKGGRAPLQLERPVILNPLPNPAEP